MVPLALSLPACASDLELGSYTDSSCDFAELRAGSEKGTLYLSTFWDDTREKNAFETTLGKYSPFQGYQNPTKQTRVDAQMELRTAFAYNKLPDAFQANGGSDVLRWTSGSDDSEVCPLNRLAEPNGWLRSYFPASLTPVSCNGDLYALPIGIHRLNLLFYNRRLFEALKELPHPDDDALVEPAKLRSALDLLEELAKVARLAPVSERPFKPLAMGGKRAWPLTIMAFEDVLLSLDEPAYKTLWEGRLGKDDGVPEQQLIDSLDAMLAVLKELVSYADLSEDEDWQEAIGQVARGEALFTMTGDWGWAQVDDALVADVAVVPFPGTKGKFVYTPDSFAVPREAKQTGERARAFLERVVADPDSLADFSRLKHSIPARMDFDVEKLATEDLKATYREFTDCSAGSGACELLLATSGLAPPPGYEGCFDDVEALLFKAVADTIPPTFKPDERTCDAAWPPEDSRDAWERLVTTLLETARELFASGCPR